MLFKFSEINLNGYLEKIIRDMIHRIFSEQWCHIYREVGDAVFFLEIVGMQNIRLCSLLCKACNKFLQGKNRIMTAGFNLYGRNIVSAADLAFRNQKVNFHSSFFIVARGVGIKIQPIALHYSKRIDTWTAYPDHWGSERINPWLRCPHGWSLLVSSRD